MTQESEPKRQQLQLTHIFEDSYSGSVDWQKSQLNFLRRWLLSKKEPGYGCPMQSTSLFRARCLEVSLLDRLGRSGMSKEKV